MGRGRLRRTKMDQPAFGLASHDSLQYHFFCPKLFFSIRFFRSASVEHHSAWLYDGAMSELVNTAEPVKQSGESHLDLASAAIELSTSRGQGSLRVKSSGGGAVLEAKFSTRDSFSWADPFGSAEEKSIYQPNLEGSIRYRDAVYKGIGFAKRYWGEYPRHWGYRWLQAVTADHGVTLWSADATFGLTKYDYFYVLPRDGELAAAEPTDSYHKISGVYGTIGKTRYRAALKEIASWETRLVSNAMDSVMRQRYCALTLTRNRKKEKGVAFTEWCVGTVG